MPSESLVHQAVATSDEMKTRTLQLVNDGYKVVSQSDDLVTLERRPTPITGQEVIIFFLLLLCCILPGVIYFWVTFVGKFKVEKVVLRLDPEAAALEAEAAAQAALSAGGAQTVEINGVTWSADQKWWWDGNQWQDAKDVPPSSAPTDEVGS
jgi:hypothetical protein